MQIYSYLYTIPYYIIFLILLLFSFLEYKGTLPKMKCLKVCSFIFIIFFCFRGFVGYDWMAYYPLFENVDYIGNLTSESFFVIIRNNSKPEPIEPGFILYTSIIKTIFNSWHAFVIITTLIPIISITYFIKRQSTNYAFSFAVFFVLYQVLLYDLMRNAMAVALFLFAVDFLYKKKYFQFVTLLLIGMTFHNSILLISPILLIRNVKFSSWFLWASFLMVNIIFWLNYPVVSNILQLIVGYALSDKLALTVESYLDSDMGGRGFTLGYLVRIIVFIVIMHYRKNIIKNPKLIFLFNAYFISILISIGMTDLKVFTSRMEINLFFPFIILYPYLLSVMNISRQRLFVSFLILYCMFKIAGTYNTIMSEYETMFNGKTYDQQIGVKSYASEIIKENNP